MNLEKRRDEVALYFGASPFYSLQVFIYTHITFDKESTPWNTVNYVLTEKHIKKVTEHESRLTHMAKWLSCFLIIFDTLTGEETIHGISWCTFFIESFVQ